MTNTVLRGKPNVGNPRVRFDEGEVAPANPRRGSLLYKRIVLGSMLFAMTGMAFGADGVWVYRADVGTGGTDWTEWSDTDNWQDGILAEGGAADLTAAKGQYVSLPDGTTSITTIKGSTKNAEKAIVRGNGTLALTAITDSIGYLYLYSDYTIANPNIYYGPDGLIQCADLTSSSGSAILWRGTSFRMDLYANAAGGMRTRGPIPESQVKWCGDGWMRFTAPHGSSTNIVAHWSQTSGSPFLARAVGQASHVLSVGTQVTGSGIPDGTFLKRVFPDGTIELSAPVTETAASNELTFSALTADVSFSIPQFYPYNGSTKRTLCLQKYREEDEIALTTLFNWGYGSSDNGCLTITTESGMLPGKLALTGDNGKALQLTLDDARLELAGDFSNSEFIIPSGSRHAIVSVPDGKSYAIGCVATARSQLVKEGAGRLTVGIAEGAFADASVPVIVKAGALAPVLYGSYDELYIASLTVKAEAEIAVPDKGMHVGQLVLEAGATVSGNGVLEYDTANENVFGSIVMTGGGLRRHGAAPTGVMGVSVVAGTYHSWAENGDTVFIFDSGTATVKVEGRGTIDLLCVGGGGGGGSYGGGGGGGGGVVYTQSIEVVAGYYGLHVGAGGAGAETSKAAGSNGGDSSVFGVVGYGGGGGGTKTVGCAGGSGGGAGAYEYCSAKELAGGAGTEGQGYAGGKSVTLTSHWYSLGGGGGGAATNGCDATESLPGDGGEGVRCAIWSADRVYGSGGGGGNGLSGKGYVSKGGTGAGAGGGNMSALCKDGVAGTDGWGSGGGGGGRYVQNFGVGGKGGSGIVIMRFRQDGESDVHERGIASGGKVRYRRDVALHAFSQNGSFTLTEPTFVDVLLVGGGGGGGSYAGGGGGGGGVTIVSNLYLAAGAYPVEVGPGGAGATNRTTAAGTGGTTRFVTDASDIYCPQAPGGGAGGIMDKEGGVGACGGGAGAGYPHKGPQCYAGGAALPNWGYDGGASTNADARPSVASKNWNDCYGGGGGGMGAPGVTGAFGECVVPGAGGDGICLNFTGTDVWYGGGGGGGTARGMQSTTQDFAPGGKGGGGIGRATYAGNCYPGTDGTDGLGGGGGGGAGLGDGFASGGNGGSGIVIIRYHVKPVGTILLVR